MNDNSMFVGFFGEYPLIKVLDFLLENKSFDYSKKEICRQTGVSWNTLELFWSKLEKDGLIIFTRQIGRASMFKLNSTNAIAKKLIELDDFLIKQSFDKLEKPLAIVASSRNLRKK